MEFADLGAGIQSLNIFKQIVLYLLFARLPYESNSMNLDHYNFPI